jgi:hypothetical protein
VSRRRKWFCGERNHQKPAPQRAGTGKWSNLSSCAGAAGRARNSELDATCQSEAGGTYGVPPRESSERRKHFEYRLWFNLA